MSYGGVNQGIPQEGVEQRKAGVKKSSTVSSKDASSSIKKSNYRGRSAELRNVELKNYVDYTKQQLIPIITDYSALGHSMRSIGFMLGMKETFWDDYYIEHEEWIKTAINNGRIIAEIEAMEWLRAGAMNGNNFSALKYYGELKFGWSGGTGAVELPSAIAFEMIEVEDDYYDGKEEGTDGEDGEGV